MSPTEDVPPKVAMRSHGVLEGHIVVWARGSHQVKGILDVVVSIF